MHHAPTLNSGALQGAEDEPFEGIAPALSERLSEVLASLKGKDLTLLMSQSDLNHSRGLIDVEFTIERGANPVTARQ